MPVLKPLILKYPFSLSIIMRLFIAIELPEEIKEHLAQTQAKIKENLSKEDKFRFVSKDQIHLTLKFLGEVQPDKLENIKELLGKVSFNPFSSNLSELGVFPNESQIRVVWAGLSPEEKIILLQKEIDGKLKKLFPKEKDFKPHLTLARVNSIQDNKSFINNLKTIKIENKTIPIDSFKLVKSTLTANGSIYEELQSFGYAN